MADKYPRWMKQIDAAADGPVRAPRTTYSVGIGQRNAKQVLADDNARATVWTYRSGAIYAEDEKQARTTILAEAYRMVPQADASATILSIRRTPTGRWSAMVKRVRA
jgi:glutamine amidotransferase-like uncharacterized protein